MIIAFVACIINNSPARRNKVYSSPHYISDHIADLSRGVSGFPCAQVFDFCLGKLHNSLSHCHGRAHFPKVVKHH